MTPVLLVGLGGALGSILRYLVVSQVQQRFGTTFPAGTIAVNVLGCIGIALVYELSGASRVSHELRLFLTTGVLGGFTTYSAFNQETLGFLHLGDWRSAMVNFSLTVICCLVGGMVGISIGRWLLS